LTKLCVEHLGFTFWPTLTSAFSSYNCRQTATIDLHNITQPA